MRPHLPSELQPVQDRARGPCERSGRLPATPAKPCRTGSTPSAPTRDDASPSHTWSTSYLSNCWGFRIQAWVRKSLGLCHWSTAVRSEEHTSELQSLMRISYAVFCLKKPHNSARHLSSYT